MIVRGCFLPLFTVLQTSHAVFCDPPSPAFPPPDLSSLAYTHLVNETFSRVSTALSSIISNETYNATSFSIEVTSTQTTLFGLHRTAPNRSSLHDGGASPIDNETCYRIASMTKPFTVLALFQLQEAGKLNLDDSILSYLPELNGTGMGLPWKDITIHSLASQQAGLPRDFAQDDFINDPKAIHELGLPILSNTSEEVQILPTCDEMSNYTRTCHEKDFLDWLDRIRPTFAPNQRPSYSNINFNLLGLVIANITGMPYTDYITSHILHPLGMTHGTGFTTPSDKQAALPAGEDFYWDFQMGVQNPTGGMYANSADISRWLRYVMSTYNAHANGSLNWFNPMAWGDSSHTTFYGMPWEILRTHVSEVIPGGSDRALTLVTKGGGLPGYTSRVAMVPEYGIGITLLIAGKGGVLQEVGDIVMKEIVQLAEKVAAMGLSQRYAGRYDGVDGENNGMVIKMGEEGDGLVVSKWVMNGRDVKTTLERMMTSNGDQVVLHLSPTLLYMNEKEQLGERWRIIPRKVRPDSTKKTIWDKFCVPDVEVHMYAGKAYNEIVFWDRENGNGIDAIELTAYRTQLKKSRVGVPWVERSRSDDQQTFIGA